ncbi:hypothetical protein BC628DRAFT_1364521 [Trametes gibbosa]|nr:hypothetical protein BC628DRAFT_1389525 [Trametes gibbosa]KAI0828181.1 hypothetical protein BC628DRAFT_1364521 [Trametes gibbosa]
MSDIGYDVWGVITGTLGLLGMLPTAWIYTQFPSRRLRALEASMREIKSSSTRTLTRGCIAKQANAVGACPLLLITKSFAVRSRTNSREGESAVI